MIIDLSCLGKPKDNPFIESFNGSPRDECLDIRWFLSLEVAQENSTAGGEIQSWLLNGRESDDFQIAPDSQLGFSLYGTSTATGKVLSKTIRTCDDLEVWADDQLRQLLTIWRDSAGATHILDVALKLSAAVDIPSSSGGEK